MPFAYAMGWNAKLRRWEKRHLGNRYVVSCRQLEAAGYLGGGTPHTKKDSGQAANTWLRDQLAGGVRRKTVERGTRATYWRDIYLARKTADAEQGVISGSEWELIKGGLRSFVDWFGADRSVKEIDADIWESYYDFIRSSDFASETKRKRMRHARLFVVWLIEKGITPNFPSLTTMAVRFANTREELRPPTTEEIKEVLAKASPRFRTLLLVMLNTGLAQIDVSDLRRNQYDGGYITRARMKTLKKNTRSVAWKVWNVTADALAEHAEKDGEHLLLTQSGKTWVRDGFKNGKRFRTDSVSSVFSELNAGFTLKALRAWGGDSIRQKFGQHVADHFLGHGQDPVERAYFARHQAELDEAVEWLGLRLV